MLSWCVAIKIFCAVCFEAITRGLDDVSKDWLNAPTPQELKFRLIITFKNNLISRLCPIILSCLSWWLFWKSMAGKALHMVEILVEHRILYSQSTGNKLDEGTVKIHHKIKRLKNVAHWRSHPRTAEYLYNNSTN